MAEFDYQDPKKSLSWLFNPNVALPETDFTAAAAAIGGGMPGSMFAQNNQLRLRDSERINRLQIGQNLLQPYLQRDFAAGQQNQQIAAQAASDAMRESGAMTRLNAEGQQRLQLALIQGDQQAADRLLTESGLDRRSAAGLAAGLSEATMRNQAGILQSLLSYSGAQNKLGAGERDRSGDGYTDFSGPGQRGTWVSTAPAPARGGASGGITGLNTTITNLLKNYGLN